MTSIYDKTDKGREEIATRKHHLAARLRTLLLLVDGKHGGKYLLQKVAGLGLGDQSLNELLEQGFIHSIGEEPVEAPPVKLVINPKYFEINSGFYDYDGMPVSDQATATRKSLVPVMPGMQSETRFQALYDFHTESIRTVIGLRGYTLQLKVDRATSVQDFSDLRQDFLAAVEKAKGRETAASFADALDKLLHSGEVPR